MNVVLEAESRTTDGVIYDFDRGRAVKGLPTGAIKPSSNIETSYVYDVVVVGAGFTGLSAARDLSLASKRVLLLEARDRIGGRTWTANVDGHNYEMGGTWIHWLQPHVWAEATRYGLADKLTTSNCTSDEALISYLNDAKTDLIYEHPEKTLARSFPLIEKFLDVDGAGGRKLFPQPYLPIQNPEVWAKWDISFQERVDQLDISKEDSDFLLAWLTINTCTSPSKASLLNLIRLVALSGYSYQQFMESSGTFKFKHGTTSLASAMFAEFKGHTLFKQAVKSIDSSKPSTDVTVTTRSGFAFRAKQVICTAPLHCLGDIDFSPPLPAAFTTTKHINFCGKVHLQTSNPVHPWFGVSDADHDVCAALTDAPSSTDGAHLVAFNHSRTTTDPDRPRVADDPEGYLHRFKSDVVPRSVDMNVSRLVWHDWTADEFSKGAWASYGPGQLSAGLGEIMTRPRVAENVVLANADWAMGWVGYIDGALEMGRRTAREVVERL